MNRKVKIFLRVGAALSMIIFPLLLVICFALHFKKIDDFFVFKFLYVQNTSEDFMKTLTGPYAFPNYILPHLIGYFSLPFMIFSSLSIGNISLPKRPWFAIIGTGLVLIGSVFMGGVFAAWLSFAAVANVASDNIPGAIVALNELTKMQGPLLITTILAFLSLLGLIILAIGLFVSKIIPRWSSILILFGTSLIMIFHDLDNWMLIGALLILIGFIPLSTKLIKNEIDT